MATYTVRPGDSLRKIASGHGTTAATLLQLNPSIREPDLIFPGQVLNLPEGEPHVEEDEAAQGELGSYVVRSGDTLGAIASGLGTSLARLVELNPQLEDPNLIRPGDTLTIPTSDGSSKVPVPPVVEGDEALWLAMAVREMETGVDERRGSADNPRIIEYHSTTTLRATSDETPWCSSFVNWCFEQSGHRGTGSAWARSWLNWGVSLDEPRRGCVVVFRRGSNPRSGHVALFWERRGVRVLVLGGNQDNQVSIKSYPADHVLGWRWPRGEM